MLQQSSNSISENSRLGCLSVSTTSDIHIYTVCMICIEDLGDTLIVCSSKFDSIYIYIYIINYISNYTYKIINIKLYNYFLV